MKTYAVSVVLTACMLVGCGSSQFVDDIDLLWTIADEDAPALCDTYAIDHWVFTAEGFETVGDSRDCRTDPWHSGSTLHGLETGPYILTVTAVDAADTELACKAQSVTLTDGNPLTVPIDFVADRFVGCNLP